MTEQNGEQTRALITSRQTSREALAKLERVAIEGDLSTLSDGERVAYYARVTESVGLNPLTRPFEYIKLNGKLTLYARKDATDQLRQVKGISIDRVEREEIGEMLMTRVYGHDRSGRKDEAMSMVPIKGLSGDALANAYMKGETKAKRRFTLSIGGLGWLDESELDTVQAQPVSVDPVTGAIETTESEKRTSQTRQRIAQRTAAMRGEVIDSGESDAGVPEGGAEPVAASSEGVTAGGSPVYSGEVLDVDDIPFDEPAGGKGDPWMRRIHAVGAERGLTHDDLHDRAAEWFGVDSMSVLDVSERAEMLDRIEAIEHAEQGNPDQGEDTSSGASDSPSPAPQSQAGAGQDGSSDRPAPMTTPVQEGGPSSDDEAPGPATAPAEKVSVPPAASTQPAPAQITDPDTLRTFAAGVLGLKLDDVWGLGDLDAFDWDSVLGELGLSDHEAYTAWYNAQKRPLRQALMAAGQSPRKRKDAQIAREAEGAIERVKAGTS